MAWPRKIAFTKPSERLGMMKVANEAAARACKRDFVQRAVIAMISKERVISSGADDAKIERALELYKKIEAKL